MNNKEVLEHIKIFTFMIILFAFVWKFVQYVYIFAGF